MMVLLKIGGGSGAASHYNMRKVATKQGALLCTTIARDDDPFQIGREFDAISALNPLVKKSIVHLVIAVSPNDAEVVKPFHFRYWLYELQKRLELDASQMIAWQHFDTAHPHIHALLNRVRPDGTVVSLWKRGLVMREFCKEMRKSFGLHSSSREEIKKEFSPVVQNANPTL